MEGGQTNPRPRRSQPAIVFRVRHRAAIATALAAALLALVAPGAQAAKPLSPAQVVRAWSRALNASDDKTAGSLFALRAIAIQGGFVVRLNTAKSAVVWNSGLPCSGRIVRLRRLTGDVVKATFVLGHRRGHRCDAPGQLAAAQFTVVKGKITRWEQVAPDVNVPVA
jgi:hypothetical protein